MKKSDYTAQSDKEAVDKAADVLRWEMSEHGWEFGEVAMEVAKRNARTGRYRRICGVEILPSKRVHVTDLRA